MATNEQLDGMIVLSFRILSPNDVVLTDPQYRSVVEGSDSKRFLLIEEAQLLLPFSNDSDLATLEKAVNAWIAPPALATRGGTFSAREVIKKLKRLGFREKSSEGSHFHFVNDDRIGKVTVPVHGGEIRKGTLKSILNQAGLDMTTFAMA